MIAACGRLDFERHAAVDATGIGDVLAPVSCGSTMVIDDPFDDTAAAPLFVAYADPGMTFSEAGGSVSFVFSPNVGMGRYSGYYTPVEYPAQEFCATLEVSELPTDFGLAYFNFVGGMQKIEFITYQGNLELRTVTAGVPSVVSMLPVDLATQKFWRLRQHAGVTYWDISSDNVMFTNLAMTTFFTQATAAPGIGAGGVMTTTNGGRLTVQQMQMTAP